VPRTQPHRQISSETHRFLHLHQTAIILAGNIQRLALLIDNAPGGANVRVLGHVSTKHTLSAMFISTNKSDKFCAAATSHASFSPMLQKHGCVAVVNGKIVGKGFNNYRNYSKDGLMRTCCSCHAEVAAIRDSTKRTNFRRGVNPLVVRA